MTTKNNPSTVGELISRSTALLTQANISTARLDSLILLEDTLGVDRAHLLTHPEITLSDVQLKELLELIVQRQQHTPLAYLRGKAMFYGRTFIVTSDTLIPRPESEDVITLLKRYFQNGNEILIADVGTGSGCLGLTATLELPRCTVDLYDIDDKALTIAKKNAEMLGVSATYYQEDLLSKATEREYDGIIANLPYVADEYSINEDARFEPKLALFSGTDGLNDYRTFWEQVATFASKPPCIITESEPDTQHKILVELAKEAGYKANDTLGFIQLFSLD